MLVKITPGKYKYNLASEDETSRQLSTSGGNEIIGVIVSAGNAPVAVRVVDTANGSAGYSRQDGFLVSAEASNSFSPVITHPIPMKKGIYVIFEQGVGSNAECFIWYN